MCVYEYNPETGFRNTLPEWNFFTLEHLGDFSHDVKQCKLKVEKQKEKTKGSNGDFSQLHYHVFFHTPDKFVL